MTHYLITNLTTGEKTWIAAASVTAALVAHENARRGLNARAALSRTSKCWHDNDGPIINVGIGESVICGLRENVVRED